MVWTRLAYLSLPDAFYASRVNGKIRKPAISSRYRNMLKKEFLKAGVPWEWDPVKMPGRHPFDRAPKFPKSVRDKHLRVAKIKAALEKQDEIQLKYRQEVLNKKKLGGFDLLVASALGNFTKGK